MAKIIVDSCCDLNDKDIIKKNITQVPLTIRIEEEVFIDDRNLDRENLIKKMRKSVNIPATSCPSPEDYLKVFSKEEDNFVVTLSDKLSGSYNSANLAGKIFQEENENAFVYVVNSKSASVGETLISFKLRELIDKGLDRNNIIAEIEKYVEESKTIFILETLENLIKAGRISRLKGKIASILSIIPIMKATEEGEIDIYEKIRGRKKAYSRLVEIIGIEKDDFRDKILGISHCNALEKALDIKKEIENKYNFKDIIIVDTQGISTVYANEGGIILSY